MPCEYKIFGEHNLIVKTFSGKLLAVEVLDLLDVIELDPNLREDMMELADLRGVTEFAITEVEARRFADLISSLSTGKRYSAKKAIVATTRPARLAAETFRKSLDTSTDLEVGIFDDFATAFGFLGIAETHHFNFHRDDEVPSRA